MSVNNIGSIYPAVNTDSHVNSSDSAGSADFASILNGSISKSGTDLDSIFEAASEKYGVSVSLLKAVAKAESNFNSQATSRCGAMGIMQLMPGTAKSLGVTDAYDPEQNIMGGAKYLSQLLQTFDGNVEYAVAAYNAGAGSVKKYDGIPPFEETQNYVVKVMGYCGSDISAGFTTTPDVSSSYFQEELSAAMGDCRADSIAQMMLINRCQLQLLEPTDDEEEDAEIF